MKTVSVECKKPYKVIVGRGVSEQIAEHIKPNCRKVAIITDENVGKLYGEKFVKLLGDFDTSLLTLEVGEENKSLETFGKILEFLGEQKLTRSDCIVALGGGIVGDIAGFAAASYLRGIDFVQVPTTLLAMVDSSVGGKTGVNLSMGKNLAGAFHQPSVVLCDESFLDTLPSVEFKNGLGEIIKYGAIADKELIEKLETTQLKQNLSDIIVRCIEIKAKIVGSDEFDNGERQKLNFGHTIGHALEKMSNFKIPHGQAVGLGMKLICLWAEERGLTEVGTAMKIERLLVKFEMVCESQFDMSALWKMATMDKKIKGNKLTIVLVKDFGNCFFHDIIVER